MKNFNKREFVRLHLDEITRALDVGVPYKEIVKIYEDSTGASGTTEKVIRQTVFTVKRESNKKTIGEKFAADKINKLIQQYEHDKESWKSIVKKHFDLFQENKFYRDIKYLDTAAELLKKYPEKTPTSAHVLYGYYRELKNRGMGMNIWKKPKWDEWENEEMFKRFREAWILAGGYILDENKRDIPTTWVETCFDDATKNENYNTPEEAAKEEWSKRKGEIEEFVVEDFRKLLDRQQELYAEVKLPKDYVYGTYFLSDMLDADDIDEVRAAVSGENTEGTHFKWLPQELYGDKNLEEVFSSDDYDFSDVAECLHYPVTGIFSDDLTERLVIGSPTVDELKKLFTISEMLEDLEKY